MSNNAKCLVTFKNIKNGHAFNHVFKIQIKFTKVAWSHKAKQLYPVLYLANRFYAAVRPSSNRSQMTSKYGKNKEVAHEAIAECVTDVLTTFLTSTVIYY